MFRPGEKFKILDINGYSHTGFKNGDIFTVVTEAHWAASVLVSVNPTEQSHWVDLGSNSNEAIRFEEFKAPQIVKENPYKVIDSEMVACFDVDETLIMWSETKKDLQFECPYGGGIMEFTAHTEHVKLLKDHYARGFTVIVWSASGFAWAKAAVDSLGLQDSVHFIMSKPSKFFDDLPAEAVLVNRVYLEYKGE